MKMEVNFIFKDSLGPQTPNIGGKFLLAITLIQATAEVQKECVCQI